MRRNGHLPRCRRLTEGETKLFDSVLDRLITSPKESSCEGMPAHKDELKDHYRKPERVVVGGSNQASERFSMEFWWGKIRDAHFAEEDTSVDTHLKGIAIDNFCSRIVCDEDVLLVERSLDAQRQSQGRGLTRFLDVYTPRIP